MKHSRRKFIKSSGILAASTALNFKTFGSGLNIHNTKSEILPDPSQLAWMDLKFGMFIHFGINTFYDCEWSDGTLDPVKYNPTSLDTDQWCRTAKMAGMKYLVITAKHHDGFCNWPTKYTEYSVKNSPWRKDLLASIVESADKYGLKTGIYYSLWDRHEKLHGKDENSYVYDFMIPQLDELLSNYGDIVELWFDGFWKKQQSGWKVESEWSDNDYFINAWRNEGAFRWKMDHVYQFVKQKQPQCIVMNNPTSKFKAIPLHPVDAVCAERGTDLETYKSEYNWLGKSKFFPLQIETTLSVNGNEKFPSGNWFWHKWDHSVASKDQIINWQMAANKLNANLLVNCGPMSNGKLRPEDVEVLSKLNP